MKPRTRFVIAVAIVLSIAATVALRSNIASAFSHPWVAFGAGFLAALIVVAMVGAAFIGMAFVGASVHDDEHHF
jgi:hypothetical protein